MERILITGASGTIGQSILRNFRPSGDQILFTATRNRNNPDTKSLFFDFENPQESGKSLEHIDTLFLLRPPRISDVRKYIRPVVDAAKRNGVRHILFLSVQGAEKMSFIPHAKIEKMIVESGIAFTFFRPSYFMENLTTALLEDIRNHDCISLPSGQAGFLWIGAEDIGRSVSAVLRNVSDHEGKSYFLTGSELLGFDAVAGLLSRALRREIRYISPGLLRFYLEKKRQGLDTSYIAIMAFLHFLPRFQAAPALSRNVEILTARRPQTVAEFINEHVAVWER